MTKTKGTSFAIWQLKNQLLLISPAAPCPFHTFLPFAMARALVAGETLADRATEGGLLSVRTSVHLRKATRGDMGKSWERETLGIVRIWMLHVLGMQTAREGGGQEDVQVSDLINWMDGGANCRDREPWGWRANISFLLPLWAGVLSSCWCKPTLDLRLGTHSNKHVTSLLKPLPPGGIHSPQQLAPRPSSLFLKPFAAEFQVSPRTARAPAYSQACAPTAPCTGIPLLHSTAMASLRVWLSTGQVENPDCVRARSRARAFPTRHLIPQLSGTTSTCTIIAASPL